MHVRRGIIAGIITFVVVFTTLVWTSKSSFASFSSCPAGRLCLYNGTNGSGVPDLYSPSALSNCENVHAGSDNSASSLYNRTAFYITLKKGTNCSGGSSLLISPGSIIYNLATPCCAWDNSISSGRLGG